MTDQNTPDGASALDRQLSLVDRQESALDPEQRLALWFLRYVLLVDELVAYDFVDDGLREIGVDAFHVRPAESEGGRLQLTLVQVKRTKQALRSNELQALTTPWHELRRLPDIRDVPRLRSALESALADGAGRRKRGLPPPAPEVGLALVVDVPDVEPDAARALDELAEQGVQVYERGALERYARALETPALVSARRVFERAAKEWLIAELHHGRALVCPVEALEIVEWPGIADRTLFDFNVRFGLGSNRVRASLDAGIAAETEHEDFLAYHNGLTVLCDHFELDGNRLTVHGLSVVNGAQSVLALADHREQLSPELRVLVKFVEIREAPDLARKVAIRSNTQNPVTARNLRALDPLQVAIQQEVAERYPPHRYDTRPGVVHPETSEVIANDTAAQLLCAVFNEKPWLAVKRDTLFHTDNYREIFNPQVTAAHVLLAHLIRQRVETQRDRAPSAYQRSWRLTALIAAYLVGQLLRVDDELRDTLRHPAKHVADPELESLLDSLVTSALRTLTLNHERRAAEPEGDDFKVDFKRETFLRRLADDAVSQFVTTRQAV